MTDEFDHLLWSYRAVFKQTDGGGGAIIVTITANERTVLLWGQTGQNDYAANRLVAVYLRDSDDNLIATLMYQAAVDNVFFPFPVSDQSAMSASDGPELERKVVMGKGDYIRISCSTPVQNEELTVAIRALIRSWPPTISAATSAGTVTTTTTYDKVI